MLKRKIVEKEKAEKRLKQQAGQQKDFRNRRKETIIKLSQSNESAAKSFKPFNREVQGRPTLEVNQPGIIEAILDIVQATKATDDRRRTEILRPTRQVIHGVENFDSAIKIG